MFVSLPISGFVLAGGRSSRMGQDKALLELAGKTLVEHALVKLGRVCSDAAILSGDQALQLFAPVFPDLHPDCGPISGLETALAHSRQEWCLLLPVDVPFVPSLLLYRWAQAVLGDASHLVRAALFQVEGVPQPTLILLHRELAPFLTEARAAGRYKLFPELQKACATLAQRVGTAPANVLQVWPPEVRVSDTELATGNNLPWGRLSPAQKANPSRYFLNLNTPAEWTEAQAHPDLLDT